jgi:hypothetical protein
MANAIGGAKTGKFLISQPEIRVGPLSRAGRLTTLDSVGLLETATFNFSNETTKLQAGLPKTTYDTTVTGQSGSVTAQAYEYTANNLRLLLNEKNMRDTRADFAFQNKAVIAANATSVTTVLPANLTASTTQASITPVALPVSPATATAAAPLPLYIFDAFGLQVAEVNTSQVTYFVAGKQYVVTPSAGTYTVDAAGIVSITFTVPATGVPVAIPAGTTFKSTSIIGSTNTSDLSEGLITAAAAQGATTIVCSISAGLKDGDLLVTYPQGQPQNLSVVSVVGTPTTTAAGITTLNIGYGSALLFKAGVGDVIYKADDIGIGNNKDQNYFSLDLLWIDHATGRPESFRFWKVALSSGLDFAVSSNNYATTPLSFEILTPTDEDITTGQLTGIANQIATRPFGMKL